MRKTLIYLAEFHYEFGLIGLEKFNERISVALWLDDKLEAAVGDPRNVISDDSILNEREELENDEAQNSVKVSIDGGNALSGLRRW